MARPSVEEVAEHEFGSNGKFKRHSMGSIPDQPDERDYEYAAVAAASRFIELPESMSLADYLPKKPWNQDPFGSCTSFTANLLVAVARTKVGLPYIHPSFMATWYWTKMAMYGEALAGQDIGCSIREAVMSTRREGVAPDSAFPYKPQYLTQTPDDKVRADAEKHQSLYFFRVDDYDKGIELDFLYRCLAEGWPVSIALPIYNSFVPDYEDSLVPHPTDKDAFQGWHAMTLYGYSLRGRRPYFKCRNQWSGEWGGRHILPSGKQIEPGTCRLPVEYVRDMGYDCWSIRVVEDDKIQGVPIEKVIK